MIFLNSMAQKIKMVQITTSVNLICGRQYDKMLIQLVSYNALVIHIFNLRKLETEIDYVFIKNRLLLCYDSFLQHVLYHLNTSVYWLNGPAHTEVPGSISGVRHCRT